MNLVNNIVAGITPSGSKIWKLSFLATRTFINHLIPCRASVENHRNSHSLSSMLFLQTLFLLVGCMVVVSWGFTLRSHCHLQRGHSARHLLTMTKTEETVIPPVTQLGRVTMYKKDSCPYCRKAKELLEGKYRLVVNYVDIEEPDPVKREEILQQMRSFSGGRNTVPQIFFNAEHLGGNDDVQKLDQDGLLIEKVEMVRKTPISLMMDHWYHPWY
eukprot:gene6977-7720_t